jgi:glycosyltransferase involved in cell wall biosynthesis
MAQLGVPEDRIHVVLHGADVPASSPENQRSGIIFYAGHKAMTGKGLQTLFPAMSILRQRMGAKAPVLKIHGHYGDKTPEEAEELAGLSGLGGHIVWLNQISMEEIARQYQRALLCVLPYTGSFAGLPAAMAAANQLPVVGTKKAGLPDHLADCAVWVDERNSVQLAERIMELLDSDQRRRELADKIFKRAQDFLSWEVIADHTLNVYEESARRKTASRN